MRTAILMSVALLSACHPPTAAVTALIGTSLELPDGSRVLLARAVAFEVAQSLGLQPRPGEAAFRFTPLPGDLSGPHGVCILRSGRVVAFRITGQSL